jgi:hypothetical protein
MTIPLLIVSVAFLSAMWIRYRQSKQERETENVEMVSTPSAAKRVQNGPGRLIP